jgi:N utilization substance protein B
MSRRSKAREVVVQMLYQVDLNPDVGAPVVFTMIDEQIADEKTRNFAKQLFGGVIKFRDMLDERISSVAENWSLVRMAATDRNVLRLGAYELLQTETPHPVVLNEAIELARKFGNDQSPQFVNGILDRLVPAEKRGPGQRTAPQAPAKTPDAED